MTTRFSFEPLWVRLETARKRLLDELEQLTADRSSMASRQGSSPWAKEDEHAIEISEFERRSALEKGLRDQLVEIDHALLKKDQGTYGLCDNCGQPIDLDRLEALPQANLCLSCKTRQVKSSLGRVSKEGL